MMMNALSEADAISVGRVISMVHARNYGMSKKTVYRLLKEMPGFAPVTKGLSLYYYYEATVLAPFTQGGANFPDDLYKLQVLSPKVDQAKNVDPQLIQFGELMENAMVQWEKLGWKGWAPALNLEAMLHKPTDELSETDLTALAAISFDILKARQDGREKAAKDEQLNKAS